MNDDEINSIAQSLEQSINGEPQSHLMQGVPWLSLTLNRDGCIAFAAELLRLAALPSHPDGSEITRPLTGIEQIHDGSHSLTIADICRSETPLQIIIDEPPEASFRREFFGVIGCALTGLLLAMTFVGGLFFWSRLIFAQF